MRIRPSIRILPAALPAILAAALVAGPGAMAADPQPAAQEQSPLVWCYDAARSLVSRKRAWQCTGKVVDDAEAKRIDADRIRRIEQKFHPAAPLFPGKRRFGSGTGFFVSGGGDAVTNFHVIDHCAGLSVTPPGGRPVAASVLATDRPHDLALLHVPFAPKAVAVFRDPPQPVAEEPVVVVGYPLLQLVAIKPVSVSGHVYRSVHISLSGRFPISIDIRHGNSGSPVLDGGGRVIGIVSAKVDTPKVYAATGRVVRDLGVAIGAPAILDLMRGNRVAPTTAAAGPPLDDKSLFDRGRALVAQIACWR
jgi:S1-C subfamily serine protease